MRPQRFVFYAGGTYVGGAEIHALNLMRALRERGDQVDCVCSGWNDGVFPSMLARAGIPAHPLKLGYVYLRKPTWTIDTLRNWPRAMLQHRALFSRAKIDWYVHMGWRTTLILAGQLPRERSVLYVVENEDVLPRVRLRYRLIDRLVGGYLAVSRSARGRLGQVGLAVDRVAVVPPIVTADEANAPTIAASAEGAVRMGVVGLISEIKGHVEAITALRKLLLVGHDCELWIYGRGEPSYEQRLRELASTLGVADAVRFMGFRTDRSQIYSNLDLVLVPTRAAFEAFGMVAAEPGLWRLPVVASRGGGLSEVVIDGETGLLFNPDDPDDLAAKIEKLLLNPQLRHQLGAAAQRSVTQRYSQATVLATFDAALQQLAGART